MRWELRNKLFGTDFVQVITSYSEKIVKVHHFRNDMMSVTINDKAVLLPNKISIKGIQENRWTIKPLTPDIILQEEQEDRNDMMSVTIGDKDVVLPNKIDNKGIREGRWTIKPLTSDIILQEEQEEQEEKPS